MGRSRKSVGSGPTGGAADRAARGHGRVLGTARAVHPERPETPEQRAACDELSYSVRRQFVDEFYQRHVSRLQPGSSVLDIGGHKSKKRGCFDIGKLPVRVTYANLSPATEPDIVCDACSVPRESGSFDAVILAEVVEHLPDPAAALREASRLLRRGGVLLATAPFLFRVHPDPMDFGRYAPDWWEARLSELGFESRVIEQQGMMFSVLAEFLRGWAYHIEQEQRFWPGARQIALDGVAWARRQATEWEAKPSIQASAYYASYSTGYGVKAVRG
jgi:SAM-dependent methyltransferase